MTLCRTGEPHVDHQGGSADGGPPIVHELQDLLAEARAAQHAREASLIDSELDIQMNSLKEFTSRMGDRVPSSRWERSAWTMIRTQEEDGCWWDTPAADYGDKWGTGFALLVLQRYFENCPVESQPADEDGSEGADGGFER